MARGEGVRGADRRLILILCGTVYLATAGGQPSPSLYPAVSRDFDLSTAVVGQLSTASMFVSIATALIFAPLSDLVGRKRMILIGLALSAAAGFGSALAPSFTALLVIRLFAGAGWASITPAVYALAADRFTGQTRAVAIGWITSCLSLGGIFTNVVMTQVAAVSSWRGSVWLYTVIGTLGVFVLARLLPADPPAGRVDKGSFRALFTGGIFAPLKDIPTRALIGSNIGRSLHWWAMLTYISSLWVDVYGVSIAVVGGLNLLTSVGYLIGVNVSSRLIPRAGAQRVNVWANALAFPVLVAETALLAPLPVMVATAALYSACMGAGYATQQTLLLAVTPAHRRGATTGLNASAVQVGGVFASVLGGIIIGTLGYRWLGPLLGWCSLAAALWIRRDVPEDAASPLVGGRQSVVASEQPTSGR